MLILSNLERKKSNQRVNQEKKKNHIRLVMEIQINLELKVKEVKKILAVTSIFDGSIKWFERKKYIHKVKKEKRMVL